MNTAPRVSVIIPSYNRREALARCLEALCEQTLHDFEVIVVDDGSIDGTFASLQEKKLKSSPYAFRLIQNEENLGANKSRNIGIHEATGELIAFLDSDCVPDAGWLECVTAPFGDLEIAAVTGVVEEDPPRNLYEAALWGMNRVHGVGDAPRLVAGNLCVGRQWLEQYPFDEDLKYGCDEEGLFLKLRAAGAVQRVVPAARVIHEHRYDGRGFFRQAWVGGKGAAWLVYKYRLWPRLDLLPLLLAYLTLPIALAGIEWIVLPFLLFALQIVALGYNDLARKGKSSSTTIVTLPLLLLFYHLRLAGYVFATLRLWLGIQRIKRISLRRIRAAASDRGGG